MEKAKGEIPRRVRLVYTHASFADNFKTYLQSDNFKFSDDERLQILRIMKCQEALLSGLPVPDASSSDECECGEEPKIRDPESLKNMRKKLFANLVKDHINDNFASLESYVQNRVQNYSIKDAAMSLALAANVPVSLQKMWGIY